MTQQIPATPVFALLMDGAQVEIRQPMSDDHEAVRALHEGLSTESHYLRFFGFNRRVAEEVAKRICREPDPDHGALGAWLDGRLVGVAEYETYEAHGAAEIAEVALAVADDMHHRGVGTLLLEHLASLARSRGIRVFRADTLAENTPMLRVFADAGLPVRQRFANGVMDVSMPLDLGDHYLDAVTERERRADVASLEPLLRPSSVAVVGAGRGASSPGGAVLGSLSSGGFTGALYAVNSHAAGADLRGIRCYASIADLPEAPELAVIAVPAAGVVQAAADCARRGVSALVVITSGLTAEQGRELMALSHRHGMRVVGPNCLGIANSETGLDATFAAGHPRAGVAGVVVQSGGVGIGLLDHLSRLRIGVSSFASVGDKYDVSANDMLMWWEADATTRLGIVHVESFGNPRKFARTARRVGRSLPLLTVIAGRSAPGARAAASHTAAALTSEVVRRALFTQAGIVATDCLGDLVDVAALLAGQPFPQGPRVAIVSNAGGAGVLAADACVDAGLSVPELDPAVRDKLAALLPTCAAVSNPVDTTAAVGADLFHEAIELIAADQNVDAVLAVVSPTALGDLRVAVTGTRKPVAGVVLGQAETVQMGAGGLPSYAFPENAARALAHAWSYGRWRAQPAEQVPQLDGIRPADVRAIIDSCLETAPEGSWLPPRETLRLLAAYGLPLVPWRWAESSEEAVRAAAELGGRVALKAHVPGVVHKSAAGALQLDLRGPAEVRRAHRWLKRRFGDSLQGVLVQAMGDTGVEVLCGAVQDDVFGPVVVFGTGGVDTDAAADRAARLAPLTEADAGELIDQVRAAALLHGHPGRRPGDLDRLRDTLMRLSQLIHDHPEIAELDLNPTIVRPDGVQAVDARIRLAPRRVWDPYLRRLR
ncbi:GNAT family N-acetyltransferase [Actinomadura barringtoniae]|uniref:GNAT family N-acetyltransferase n=1 Tax=Actinomadura barringtoniae TaxID=1427535 RepID=A0A939TG93_9ACTN|nr:bifunctional GNAT family N-acetyltransferase/acetate--CoA ligase family protein [Actinomadura barringtoniae]MBO2455200.1 GNAT family N-acetyltransferase [Actinomadura barringtoniae]